MIAKAKAIAHGKVAIEYAMRESKYSEMIASNLIQNNCPEGIYSEYTDIQKYNSRCKNKFIRIEIGIAPQDEDKLTKQDLLRICYKFSKRFGFDNHQWIACIHRDTDNLHMHMIVNRIGLDQSVYDTSFISKKAGIIAEKISREIGLTIANQIKAKSNRRNDIVSFERMVIRAKIENMTRNVLAYRPISLNQFIQAMKTEGVVVYEAKNRKGNTYGLRFTAYGETFKASTVGKEFGYRTLLDTFIQNQTLNITQDSSNQQSQSTVPNIGFLLSAISHGSGSNPNTENNEEEKTKKRRYGR